MTDSAEFLAGVPLFAGLPPALLEATAARAERIAVPAGTWLFRQHDEGDSIYVVRHGRVELVAEHPARRLGVLGPGATLGELSLLMNQPRAASARVMRDAELLTIGRDDLVELLDQPEFVTGLLRVLGEDLDNVRPRGGGRPDRGVLAVTGGTDARAAVRRVCGDDAVCLDAFGGPTIEEAEARYRYVFLLPSPTGDAEWEQYRVRQADRLVDLGSDRDVRRVTGRAVGVVLSGGGARCLAHAGAVAQLMDEGVVIDRIGGVGVGAVIAAMVAKGMSGEQLLRCCHDELVRRRTFRDYTLPRAGLLRGRRLDAMLRRTFGDLRIEDLPIDFFCVSADLASADVVVLRHGPLRDALRASAALPGLLAPVPTQDRILLDGTVLSGLPVRVLADGGEGPVIAIDVLHRRWSEAADPDVLPSIVETLSRSAILAGSADAMEERALADVVIEPDTAHVGHHAFHHFHALVQEGRRAAKEALGATPLGVGA